MNAIPALDKLSVSDNDEKVGVDIIRKALEAPMRAIASNAGYEGSVVVEKVKGLPAGEGVNFANGETGNMIAMGVNRSREGHPYGASVCSICGGAHPHH